MRVCRNEKEGRSGTYQDGGWVARGRGEKRKTGAEIEKEGGITRESDAGKCDSSVFIKINTV